MSPRKVHVDWKIGIKQARAASPTASTKRTASDVDPCLLAPALVILSE